MIKNVGNSSNSFEKEKKYKIGTNVFNVRREHMGTRKIGEILSEVIIKKAGSLK